MNYIFLPQLCSVRLFTISSIYFPSSRHIPSSEPKIIHVDRKWKADKPERLFLHCEALNVWQDLPHKLRNMNERDFETYILFFWNKPVFCMYRGSWWHELLCQRVCQLIVWLTAYRLPTPALSAKAKLFKGNIFLSSPTSKSVELP